MKRTGFVENCGRNPTLKTRTSGRPIRITEWSISGIVPLIDSDAEAEGLAANLAPSGVLLTSNYPIRIPRTHYVWLSSCSNTDRNGNLGTRSMSNFALSVLDPTAVVDLMVASSQLAH